MSSFTPRLLFWRTNKRKMNLPSGTQKSITTNAPQGFSMYFKPDNNNHVGRTKDNLNKHWFTPEYLLCAGHGAAHWKYMISTNSRDISNRKLWWALPLVTHMPSLRPRVWKELGLKPLCQPPEQGLLQDIKLTSSPSRDSRNCPVLYTEVLKRRREGTSASLLWS